MPPDEIPDDKLPPDEALPNDKPAESNKFSENTDEGETTKMDVHHHTHTSRKRWKHYVFEFFMLFLAVFCGFIAEWQLEHLIEHKREKQYIASFIEDLKRDTANLSLSIAWWKSVDETIEELHPAVTWPVSENTRPILYNLASRMYNFDDFIYTDRTIEQLRNSGNFRLIRKKNVSDALIDYDSFIRSQLRDQERFQLGSFAKLLDFQSSFFDSEIFRKMGSQDQSSIDSLQRQSFGLSDHPALRENLFKYKNHLFLYQKGAKFLARAENRLKKQAVALVQLMQKEYYLE